MRLLHTSDWHLGRMLHGLDLLPAQADVLGQIRELVAEPPDGVPIEAVIVAGDVYDRAVPPVEAVALFERTLAELAQHTTVIVSSGNHDSAIRLGFGSRLFTDRIRLRTDLASVGTPVLLGPDDAPTAIYPLPYLDPDAARLALSPDGEPLARSHQAVMTAAMDRVRADLATRPGHRCVVAAHAFVVGGQPSDSERSILVGGVDSVAADTFAGADYVALGHLHGPQQPRSKTATVLAYSGSPLRYSFSELAQAKSVNLVDLPPAGPVTVTPVPLVQPRPMATLTGTLDELLATDGYAEHWLSVTLTDRARPDRPIDRLRARFPHLLHVEFVPTGLAPVYPSAQLPVTERDPRELAADFIAHVTGVPAAADELELFARAYGTALAEASAG
ncbi:MAG TPA: exonuclease SbcCD subunit D [Jatrophihabitans sp.]|nr:exonuclease SbcCD subunit D [Jatrophihabitans sp.]